jgi:hypothetical protein
MRPIDKMKMVASLSFHEKTIQFKTSYIYVKRTQLKVKKKEIIHIGTSG